MPSRFLRRDPSQARSRALVDAVLGAFDAMLTHDDRDVTIERLVERAGVGIGSFYEYFTNKDSLVGALVERATRDNFAALLARFDAAAPLDLDAATRALATAVVETYLRYPRRTRVLLGGIGRLGLMPIVFAEQQRFATELAGRALRYVPATPIVELEAAMGQVVDAAIGVLVAELYRSPRPLDEVSLAITRQSLAILEYVRPRSARTARER